MYGERMKKFIIGLSLLSLIGCTSKTEFGSCIGALEEKNPKLQYKVSAENIILAVLFFEMVAPPIIVFLNETHCPVGNK